jgi:hypothetical protein
LSEQHFKDQPDNERQFFSNFWACEALSGQLDPRNIYEDLESSSFSNATDYGSAPLEVAKKSLNKKINLFETKSKISWLVITIGVTYNRPKAIRESEACPSPSPCCNPTLVFAYDSATASTGYRVSWRPSTRQKDNLLQCIDPTWFEEIGLV